MNWPTAFALVGGIIAGMLGCIKVVSMIWGKEIKKACSIKFAEIGKVNREYIAEIEASGELRREECMEKFKAMKDATQTNNMNIATLQIEMKNIGDKVDNLKHDVNKNIDELKGQFGLLDRFIRENFRASNRK